MQPFTVTQVIVKTGELNLQIYVEFIFSVKASGRPQGREILWRILALLFLMGATESYYVNTIHEIMIFIVVQNVTFYLKSSEIRILLQRVLLIYTLAMSLNNSGYYKVKEGSTKQFQIGSYMLMRFSGLFISSPAFRQKIIFHQLQLK